MQSRCHLKIREETVRWTVQGLSETLVGVIAKEVVSPIRLFSFHHRLDVWRQVVGVGESSAIVQLVS